MSTDFVAQKMSSIDISMQVLDSREESGLKDHKRRRHAVIAQVLAGQVITKQSELVAVLARSGFEATQASISRDFRELGVVKVGGKYAVLGSTGDFEGGSSKVRSRTGAYVRSIHTAGPYQIILKTEAGAANVVAKDIDESKLSGVVGTIAGDDTVFVATSIPDMTELLRAALQINMA